MARRREVPAEPSEIAAPDRESHTPPQHRERCALPGDTLPSAVDARVRAARERGRAPRNSMSVVWVAAPGLADGAAPLIRFATLHGTATSPAPILAAPKANLP